MDDEEIEYAVVIQPRAERDIAEAFEFIYSRATEPAFEWYFRLKAQIQGLAKMPTRYPVAPESHKLGYELRQLIYGKRIGQYRIVFRIIATTRVVDVLTVRHGARRPLQAEDFEED